MFFRGTIVRGGGIARTLGYPTANLDVPPKKISMRDGVYAARVTHEGAVYDAALIIQEHVQKVEVYLFAYDGPDFYGAELEVMPVQKVSEIEAMDGDELKAKIAQDIAAIKEVLLHGDEGSDC